jgi:hypothetical protein
MNINVSESLRDHFWEDTPSEVTHEFWAFRFPPKCAVGDKLIFRFDGEPVAEAVVDFVEKPGESSCSTTGKFKNRYKVFWRTDSFKNLKG